MNKIEIVQNEDVFSFGFGLGAMLVFAIVVTTLILYTPAIARRAGVLHTTKALPLVIATLFMGVALFNFTLNLIFLETDEEDFSKLELAIAERVEDEKQVNRIMDEAPLMGWERYLTEEKYGFTLHREDAETYYIIDFAVEQ